jgi:MoaA/NifB/PqqE/SkfB family radical SAM enzyme
MSTDTHFLKYPYLFAHYVLARQKPMLASFKVTYACNLHCRQCPFYQMHSAELRYEEACQILDKLYERGNRLIVIEGGEPFLWHDREYDLGDIVLAAKKRFFSVGVTTNGTFPLGVPADVIWVSLDGLQATHNLLRGAPVFDKALHNIRNTSHPRIYAHITINAINAPEIPALIRFLENRVKGMTIQFYYPYNRKDELFLDFDKREKLLDEIIFLKRRGYKILNSTPALQALKRNTWKCDDRLIDNANPDGSISQGCYLKNRADIDCRKCGFSPYTEISLACRGNLQSILAGRKIFL